jgi:hypothetical protein
MCLVTSQKKALIAEYDLTVYKWLRVEINSDGSLSYSAPYQMTDYILNELYTTGIADVEDDWDKCAFDTIDSNALNNLYRDSKGEPNWSVSWYCGDEPADLKYIGSGFHACLTLERAKDARSSILTERRIFECTIPAGSEYYLNPSNLIVSNNIIIHKEIEE